MRWFGPVLLSGGSLLAAACGSSAATPPPGDAATDGAGGPGSASVTGMIGGSSVATTEAVGILQTTTNSAGSTTTAGFSISNMMGTCALLQSHDHSLAEPEVPNAASLALYVEVPGTTVAPGTYPITQAGAMPDAGTASVSGGNFTLDGNCKTTTLLAVQGSITLTAVGPSVVVGTFDITSFSSTEADHVSGTFTAPVCDFDLYALTGSDGGSSDAGDGGFSGCQ